MGKADCFDMVLVKQIVVITEKTTKEHKYFKIIYELLINLLSLIFTALLVLSGVILTINSKYKIFLIDKNVFRVANAFFTL